MKDLILFLVRKKLKVKKGQRFKFKNQANKFEVYYIDDEIFKITNVRVGKNKRTIPLIDKSNLSLNFLLSDEAQELIIRM